MIVDGFLCSPDLRGHPLKPSWVPDKLFNLEKHHGDFRLAFKIISMNFKSTKLTISLNHGRWMLKIGPY
jgi:hypothetical protein